MSDRTAETGEDGLYVGQNRIALFTQMAAALGDGDTTARWERRRCGRWLALNRLQLGLSCEAIAAQAGVSPSELMQIELGLDVPEPSDDRWGLLAACLATPVTNADLVMAIISIALIERVCCDLTFEEKG